MGKYPKGDHVKIEVRDEQSRESEWLWMLVDRSDDRQRLVFGKLDNEPIVNTDMYLGQELAVSYDKVREHRKF
jgi:DNA-directed RNA polymerase sigma subunit (sigma70/sigma32)